MELSAAAVASRPVDDA